MLVMVYLFIMGHKGCDNVIRYLSLNVLVDFGFSASSMGKLFFIMCPTYVCKSLGLDIGSR